MRKHLQSSHLLLQTKFTIHKTLIRPVLLYGSKTWVLTKKKENQLPFLKGRFTERYAARKSKIESTGEGITTNSLNSPNALNFTKTSRFRYAGNIIRRPEDIPQKALFRAKPNRRRNQGRPCKIQVGR
jgi:hypothetical protein